MKRVFPVSLDEEMIDWIKKQVKKGNFRNRSHVVEFILEKYRQKLLHKYDRQKLKEIEKKIIEAKKKKDEKGISSKP